MKDIISIIPDMLLDGKSSIPQPGRMELKIKYSLLYSVPDILERYHVYATFVFFLNGRKLKFPYEQFAFLINALS